MPCSINYNHSQLLQAMNTLSTSMKNGNDVNNQLKSIQRRHSTPKALKWKLSSEAVLYVAYNAKR